MNNKNSVFKKALSILLTALLLFGTVSLGIVFPETKITANAATIEVSTLAQFENAIKTANAAGAGAQTEIKLAANINAGETAALTAITGNVLFDLNGKNLIFDYSGSCAKDVNNYDYQLPSDFKGQVYNNSDYFNKGIINVAAGGNLQIINSSATSSTLSAKAYLTRNSGSESSHNYTMQVTSNLIYSEGSVIVGRPAGTNNFTLFSEAAVNCNTGTWDNAKIHTYAHSVAITMNSTNGVFKMYGGKIDACACANGKRDSGLRAICYGVYLVSCYSGEIYDGSINIVDTDSCGIKNSDGTDTDENLSSYFCAVKVASPNVYIFNLTSSVKIYVDKNTDKAEANTANIYSVNNVKPYIYGGKFENNSSGRDHKTAGWDHNYTILGSFSYADGGYMNPGSDKSTAVNGDIKGFNYKYRGATPTAYFFTPFYFADKETVNGIYPWDYATFRDYLDAHSAETDAYYEGTYTHINDSSTVTFDTAYKYRRLGYSYDSWVGAKMPGVGSSTAYANVGAAGLNATSGGSVFLYPNWKLNTYTISYDLNDNEGLNKATNPNAVTSYNITSTSALPLPVRHGYTFVNWECTDVTYLATDDDVFTLKSESKPWARGLSYKSGVSLTGKVGSLKLKANWVEDKYTATFTLNGGNIDGKTDDVTANYTVNSTFSFPTGVSKAYYTFDNYWKVTGASGNWSIGETLYSAGSTSPTGMYGAPTFTAQYTPIDYTAKFDSDGGSTVDPITYNVESTGVLPASSRTGYTFVGWSVVTSDDAKWESGKVYPAGASFKDMHGNVTLKAVWETLTSKVTLELGSDESIAGNKELTYSYSSSLMLNTPVKKGYTFLGWRVKSTSTGASWMPGHEYLLSAGETQVTLPGGMLGDVVLVPMWEAVTYEITYNSDGGTAYEKQSYTIEKTVTLPTPAKNGYVFNGWSVSVHDSDYNWTNSSYDGGASLVGMYGSVTLKANWSRASYTVKFNSDGGNVIADRAYDIENGTPNLPTPSKTAYTFVRWVVESTDPVSAWRTGEVFTDALPAGRYGNVTLKAEWKPSEYTILFSDGQQQTYTYESEFSLHTPDRAGYKFEHWTVTSSNGNWELNKTYTASDRISKMYGEVHLEAVFTPCEYTVEYQDENGNELAPASSYKTGETVTLASFSKAGYTFLGWRVKSDSDGSWGVDSIITASSVDGKYGNVVLVPELEAITYTVTYKTDGGNAVPAGTYTVETGLTLGTTEKTGHNLEKWVVESTVGNWTAGDELVPGATVSGKYGNVTLTAKWTPKIYNITFITGNGEKQVVHSAYGQETPTLPGDYSKPADARYTYTFSHWEPALARVTGDATYTAVYTETLNEYTVTWRIEQTEGSGSYSSEATTWKYGETPAYNGVPTQNPNSSDHKMRFVGWEPAITEVTGNAVYTARFVSIANPQTVKWYNGSTLLATTEWSIGEVPHYSGATPVRPDENGYRFEFVGWATTDNGDVIDPLPAIVKGQDVNYYAVFEKKAQSYTVTLDANGGSVAGGTSIGYTYAEAMTEVKLPTPEKTGYSFTGWRVDSTDGTWTVGEILTGNVRVNAYGNVTVSAQWEKITYTLTFAGEGAAVPSMTYDIESDAVLPDASKDGSELVGWLVSAGDGSWAQGTTVEVAMSLKGSYGNATLTPVYKAKTYTIKWISGDIVQTTEVQFGSAIIPYEPIPKQGYTAEWDKEVPATMPASDLEFVAVYTPIQYYLRLNLNGGTGAESFYYDSDTTDVLPIPTRDGATFVGWRVTSSSGNWNVGTLVAGGTALKGKYGNTILTAQWKFDVFTVTWVAGDETRVSKWYYGATPSFDGTPYKSPDNNYSYVFIGWDKEITTVTGDVTYTALFEKTERVYTIRWNVDGVITEQQYSYGDMPEFGGETPSRASTPEYDFFFDGWSPEVGTVTDDVTYVAQFRVFVKLQGLSLNKSAMFLDIDASESLTAEIYPSTASAKDVLWASSDASVATVDAVGKVTAVNAGIAIISVSSGDGNFKSYCVVTVAPKLTSYIEITANGVSTTNIIGTSVQLYASVKPDDATDRTFTWSSDNPGIASVDEFGMVRFNSKGTTTIRVVTSDGYAKGSIEVTSTEDKTGEETVKTYGIRFLDLACPIYLIDDNGNRHTFESNEIVCVPAGSTIRFRPARPYYVIANGVQLEQDAEYVIENVQKNYIISTSKAAIVTPEDPDDAPTFIRKLQEFFRKIVQFFKSLFGTK